MQKKRNNIIITFRESPCNTLIVVGAFARALFLRETHTLRIIEKHGMYVCI